METLRQTGAALFVLGLLGVLLYWLRGKGLANFGGVRARRGSGRRMESLERLTLSPQHSLHLVRVGGRVLLVASAPGGCTVVETGELDVLCGDARAAR
jgi:flagellar biogenesis protein FliO